MHSNSRGRLAGVIFEQGDSRGQQLVCSSGTPTREFRPSYRRKLWAHLLVKIDAGRRARMWLLL